MNDIYEYLDPVPVQELCDDASFTDGHLGHHVSINTGNGAGIDEADLVILGIPEFRGTGPVLTSKGPDAIRKELYNLYYWHREIRIADLGNIRKGKSLADTYAAVTIVISELLESGKTVILLGGSHDLTLAQYGAYASLKKSIECTCVDSVIDLKSESPVKSSNFLLEMLTLEPNYIRHFNHIGFQTYLVHPRMMETLDKLRFDCYRLGRVKEDIEEMEPVIRNSHMFSFDISAIKNSDSPASRTSPNGLDGIEACTLCRYAGMSTDLKTFGIYGYVPDHDRNGMSALQIAQMVWYFIDGRNNSRHESSLSERQHYNEYHTVFGEIDTTFLQSKRTGRWWMQLPDSNYIACSPKDYFQASHNQIPERWLRSQERL